jgi:hypothetical protein
LHRRKATLIVSKLDFWMLSYRAKAGAFVDDEILNFHAARSLDGNPIKANILSDLAPYY